MLWVRIPPELFGSLKGEVRSLKFHTSPFLLQTSKVLVEQRSARLPVTQEVVGSNPIGDAFKRRGTQTGKATELKPP